MSATAPLILVVDDDIDILNWTALILEESGYRTCCCGTTDEAMRSVERELPALVITDLMMDSLHAGFSFVQRVRANPHLADLPIIIVTAAASRKGFDFNPRTKEDLEAMQVQAFFPKPVDAALLLEEVSALLAKVSTGNDKEGK